MGDDDRGRGIGDAARLLAGATELIQAFSESDSVAEEPEIHLRPHVEAWCQRDERLALIGDNTDDPDAYILELEWRARTAAWGSAGSCLLPRRLLRRNCDLCPREGAFGFCFRMGVKFRPALPVHRGD